MIETFVAITEYPGLTTHKDMLEAFADHAVEFGHVVRGDTFSVGRVGDKNGGLRCAGKLLEGQVAEGDVARKAGAADVLFGASDGLGGDVGAVAEEVEVAFGGVVVADGVEEVGVEVCPAFKGEGLAVDAGRDVEGDHGGFDEQCAGAAHGVDEV